MSRIIHGVVHGRTIELQEDPGVGDGQQVQIVLTAVPAAAGWGDGIRRSAGAAADIPDFERAFGQIAEERRAARFRENAP